MLGKYDTYEEFKKKQVVEDLDHEVEAVQLFHQKNDVRINSKGSDIINFLTEKKIFVTGGTGFLGKSMVEKLLRCCPTIGRVYVLVRSKKQVPFDVRLEQMFEDPVFFPLMDINPGFREKISAIQGDISLPNLGLSKEDRDMLVQEVNIIYHIAATTKFDEKIRLATALNVRGTIEILELAKECKHLNVFTHVSTAYSHCPREQVDEVFYDPPIDPDELVQITSKFSDEILEEMLPKLLGNWPNTYSFTKAVAEEVVRTYSNQLPICLIRPSIVVSTYKEPVRGWTDNLFGPMGLIAGAGAGLIRVLCVGVNTRAEVVPCDYVTNAIIASSYQRAKEISSETKIYNFVTDRNNFTTFGDFVSICVKYALHIIPVRCIWHVNFFNIENKFIYLIMAFLIHTIPAYVVDIFMIVAGKKMRLTKIYDKIHKLSLLLSYFNHKDWHHSNQNTQKLWSLLKKEDQKAFPFDMSQVNFKHLYLISVGGIRTFVFREPWSNLKQARQKQMKLLILKRTVQGIVLLFVLGFLYMLFTIFC